MSSAAFDDLDVPRSNGELVFAAPWETRAFGMAVALHEQGTYDWDAFRARLVAEIGAAEPDDGSEYYERWIAALERLLVDRGVVDDAAIERRVAELAHEEAHDHEHHHHH
jgi:nitrile hydratase accessory protein